MARIALVCARFHRENVEEMLGVAKARAEDFGIEVVEVIWVPGSLEIPLALKGLILRDDIDGAACLGIIEKGETQHGLVLGQAVVKTILELQLEYDKPIGLGVIGPGADPEHVEPRLVPHARGAIDAIAAVL
ncbi:MAG: 6,7-dimethyl-8-ribityllumazine synthase [Euryarchaeota archaeon]|nr:6,7-dimethyl-8-ribityllumazine synthase [Euryarchaeota archaeon]MBT7938199.1 6,7-dimethyl-8-ribityllumazine synthase [Euryarchaeota archaeon]